MSVTVLHANAGLRDEHPVADPRVEVADRAPHARLLLGAQVRRVLQLPGGRHDCTTSRRDQNRGSILTSWIAWTTHAL
jgi:hypothetical protein